MWTTIASWFTPTIINASAAVVVSVISLVAAILVGPAVVRAFKKEQDKKDDGTS